MVDLAAKGVPYRAMFPIACQAALRDRNHLLVGDLAAHHLQLGEVQDKVSN